MAFGEIPTETTKPGKAGVRTLYAIFHSSGLIRRTRRISLPPPRDTASARLWNNNNSTMHRIRPRTWAPPCTELWAALRVACTRRSRISYSPRGPQYAASQPCATRKVPFTKSFSRRQGHVDTCHKCTSAEQNGESITRQQGGQLTGRLQDPVTQESGGWSQSQQGS
jgi:hypothetical protein